MNVDGRHRTFSSGDDCELGLRSNVSGCIHAVNTRLARVVHPNQTGLGIQSTSECFVEVSREFDAETEEQRVALERLAFAKKNALQLRGGFVAFQSRHCFRSYCDTKLS